MKKIFFIIFVFVVSLSFSVYALDTSFLDMRNKFFADSKEIKALITPDSKDMVLITSLWDTCIIATTQIDAYFSMLGIFNTIKEQDLSKTAADYLIGWLNEMKNTNELNLKSLNLVPATSDPNLKARLEKLNALFNDFNNLIDRELSKINMLKRAIRKK